jgi:hypothetical protein
MKQKRWSLTLLLSVVSLAGFSQSLNLDWVFQHPYGNSGSVASGTPDQLGQYYLIANYLETNCFATQVVVCKVSDQGNLIWDMELIADTGCIDEGLNSIYKVGEDFVLEGRRTEGWLIRLDSAGTILWESDSGLTFTGLSLSSTGRLVVTSPPGAVVYNYDVSGNYQWSQTLDPLYSPSGCASLISNNDQGYFFCNTQDTALGEIQAVGLYSIDANGNLLFDSIINYNNSNDPDYALDICENEFNEIFMLSKDQTNSGIYVNKYDPVQQSVVFASYLPQVNTTPQSIQVDSVNHFIYADAKCSNGFRIIKYDYQLNALDTIIMDTCIIGSEAYGISPTGFLYVSYRPFGQDKFLYLNAYDPMGNCLVSFSYMDTINILSPKWIQFDTLGNIFVVGNSPDGMGNNFGLVMKFNGTVGVNESVNSETRLILNPNPAEYSTKMSWNSEVRAEFVYVYTLTGQVVYYTNVVGSTLSLDTESYLPGMYFVELVTATGERISQKLIIQKP